MSKLYYREQEIQKSCVKQFLYRYTPYFKLLHHSPNEGTEDPKRGARLKAMGVQPGYPDLELAVARNGYHGLYIELKTEKGRQSDEQKEQQRLREEQGYKYVVVRSINEFLDVMYEYLGPEIDPDVETLRKILESK